MHEKKILIFYPHNFTELSSGTHKRIWEMCKYFKARGFITDLFSMNGFSNSWLKTSAENTDLFRNIYLFDWHKFCIANIPNYIRLKSGRLPDLALPKMCRQFNAVVNQEKYDYVLISYIFWANLTNYVKNAVKILDLHDFITLNQHLRSNTTDFKLGNMFQDEVQAINKFDYALSSSEEETTLWEPFCPGTSFLDAPISFPEKFQDDNSFDYDILFVGSGDNPFNRNGMLWFVEKVYPLLGSTVSIAVVGDVCTYLKETPNLHLLHHIDDLDDIYHKTRIVICPMLRGTGIKSKLVEAISYGKPVVTTKMGLSGIIQKDNNGCILANDEQSFAQAINNLLSDKDYYQTVKTQAIEFFKKKFTREVWWKSLDTVFLPE